MKLLAHKHEKFESFFSLSLELVQVCGSNNILDCSILYIYHFLTSGLGLFTRMYSRAVALELKG